MPIIAEDKIILRELALKYRECAEHPANAEREARARRIHALNHERPIVGIHEVPWNEMNAGGQLTCFCQDSYARRIEWFFRSKLFQWQYFPGDMVLEKFFRIQKAFSNTFDGLSVIENDIRITDKTNYIISHTYTDQLDTEEKLNLLQMPVVTAHPETDAQRKAFVEEMFGDILPPKITGTFFTCGTWDRLARIRGVEPMYYDLALRPDFMHETARRYMNIYLSAIDQMDALGLFSGELNELHCTPAWCDELDETERKNGRGSAASTWCRAVAQPFGSVSPDMHEEFDTEYVIPVASRFGLTYYGCCEPLHDRVDILKRIPNLRKVGATPWANIPMIGEALGKDYVMSRKPNPALVGGTLDEDAIRAEVRETAEVCIRYGCPWDYTLKDISTVKYTPTNLFRWHKIVQETLDEYY